MILFKFNIFTTYNRLIYLLKKIPIIKKLVPLDAYKKYMFKDAMFSVGAILVFLKNLISSFAYFFVFFYLPKTWLNLNNDQLLHIFFILSIILGTIYKNFSFGDDSHYHLIKVLNYEPKKLYLNLRLFDSLKVILFFSLFLKLYIDISYYQLAILLILNLSFKLIYDSVLVIIYNKYNYNVFKNIFVVIFSSLLLIASITLPIYFNLDLSYVKFVFNPAFYISSFLVASFLLYYIIKKNIYKSFSSKYLKYEAIQEAETVKKENTKLGVIVSTKELKKTLDTKNINSSGYKYLHDIFFLRYKKKIVRPIIFKVIFSTIIFIATIVLYFFDFTLKGENLIALMLKISFFIAYMDSFGDTYSRMLYYNMDKTLLLYKFYLNESAIVTCFKIRLNKLIKINLISSGFISLYFSIYYIFFSTEPTYYMLVVVLIIFNLLTIIYATNKFLIYYAFQPFSETTKFSFMNSFNNFLFIAIGYAGFQVRTTNLVFFITLIGIITIYTLILLINFKKLAKKNFRYKD